MCIDKRRRDRPHLPSPRTRSRGIHQREGRRQACSGRTRSRDAAAVSSPTKTRRNRTRPLVISVALPFESAMPSSEVTGRSADAQRTAGAIPVLPALARVVSSVPCCGKCRTPPPWRRRRVSCRRPEQQNSTVEGALLSATYTSKNSCVHRNSI